MGWGSASVIHVGEKAGHSMPIAGFAAEAVMKWVRYTYESIEGRILRVNAALWLLRRNEADTVMSHAEFMTGTRSCVSKMSARAKTDRLPVCNRLCLLHAEADFKQDNG